MRIVSILNPALFIYECVRIIILAFTLVYQLPADSGGLLWMVFTLNGVIFPIMALFIWIDISRYKPYLPLFIAGKCIGILSLLGWFIIFRQVTIIKALSGINIIAELIFLTGDLLALAAVLLIFIDIENLTEKPDLTEKPVRHRRRINNADNSNSERKRRRGKITGCRKSRHCFRSGR